MSSSLSTSSSSPLVQIRPLEPTSRDDQEFVWRMLQHAAHETETNIDEVKTNPLLRPYAEDYGNRPGDLGVVAFLPKNSNVADGSSAGSCEVTGTNKRATIIPIGAAWVRALGAKGFAASELRQNSRDTTASPTKDDDKKDVALATAAAAEVEEVESLPELAIACLPEHCGMGVGSTLLEALIQLVRQSTNPKYPGICLSCRQDNLAAMRLYERVGFEKVPLTEHPNRVGGTSVTMKYMF